MFGKEIWTVCILICILLIIILYFNDRSDTQDRKYIMLISGLIIFPIAVILILTDADNFKKKGSGSLLKSLFGGATDDATNAAIREYERMRQQEQSTRTQIIDNLRILETTRDELQGRITNIRGQINQNQRTIDELNANHRDFVERLGNNHRQELQERDNQIAAITRQRDELNLRIEQLNKEHEELNQQRREGIGLEREELNQRFTQRQNETRDQVVQLTRERDDLNQRIVQLTQQNEEITRNLETANQLLIQRDENIRGLEENIRNLNIEQQRYMEQVNTLNKNIEELNQRLQECEAARERYSNYIVDMQNQSQGSYIQLVQIQNRLNDNLNQLRTIQFE